MANFEFNEEYKPLNDTVNIIYQPQGNLPADDLQQIGQTLSQSVPTNFDNVSMLKILKKHLIFLRTAIHNVNNTTIL